MRDAKCPRPSGSRSRQAGRLALLIAWGLQGCTSFASTKDTLALGGDDPSLAGPGSILATSPPCAAAPAECNPRPVAQVSLDGRGTELPTPENAGALAHLPDPGDASALDAGAPHSITDAAGGGLRDAEAPGECQGPGEFSSPSGSVCYLWVAELASWDDAQAACLAWGGTLARIDSAEQDQLLAEHMSLDSWLGANDRVVESQFVWFDATGLTFSNWAEAQPDDFGGLEDCVEKLQRNQAWNDQLCSKLDAYFCQRALSAGASAASL